MTLEIFDILKKHNRYDIVIIESATLFEDEYETLCDEIWYIHTDVKDRKDRLDIRGDLTADNISKIISYQKMPSEFKKLCNITVDNNKDINSLYNTIDRLLS